MNRTISFVTAMLFPLSVPVALAGTQPKEPYAVAPHTADWLCAQNTSQFAQGSLKEVGLVDPAQVDDDKTDIRLLLKKSFGGGRHESVFYMTLHQHDGKSVSIVTESTTESDGECPGSAVKVFVVSHELGEWPSLDWVLPPKK